MARGYLCANGADHADDAARRGNADPTPGDDLTRCPKAAIPIKDGSHRHCAHPAQRACARVHSLSDIKKAETPGLFIRGPAEKMTMRPR
ncbi:hypothetical protein CBM2637_B120012 [Cupriavidus taiwanensis]|nr:hypothetical protein CBM2637_B120012 [Cupriavidus taiwanensis]